MLAFIIFLVFIILCVIYDPYIDATEDFILLWYNKGLFNTEREYKVLYKRN